MVELHEGYNFVNWLKDWFGLVCELQVVKVRYSETVYNFTLSQKLLSPKTASKTDLWTIFEYVLVIFMRWPYYNFCSL
jgi:hypothetical protein